MSLHAQGASVSSSAWDTAQNAQQPPMPKGPLALDAKETVSDCDCTIFEGAAPLGGGTSSSRISQASGKRLLLPARQ